MASALAAQPNSNPRRGTPPTAPLLQDPGDGAVRAFLQKDAGDVGCDAEADVDRHAVAELHGDAAGDDLLGPELGDREVALGPHGFAADGGVEDGLRGLPLLRLDDHAVDQHARHVNRHRRQRAGVRAPLDLGDDDSAVVARGQRLVESAEVGPLVLPGNVAARVGGGAANDGDIGHDRREMEPGVTVELGAADDGVGRGCVVHGAALQLRIDERAEPYLGEHARALGRGIAGHVEENPARHVVGGDRVFHDQAPDRRHRQGGGAGGKGACDHAGEEAGPCEVVDPLDPVHVPGGDRVHRGQVAGAAGALEPLADGTQHAVGAAEAAGGADRDDGTVRDQRRRLVR